MKLASEPTSEPTSVPTCETGWKQVTDDCPVCGPAGPCEREPERVRRSIPLPCRFGWHQWAYSQSPEKSHCQRATCRECGREKDLLR